MIEDQYSVNIYFLVVFDINLDVTLCSLLAAGFSAVPVVFLVVFLFSDIRKMPKIRHVIILSVKAGLIAATEISNFKGLTSHCLALCNYERNTGF